MYLYLVTIVFLSFLEFFLSEKIFTLYAQCSPYDINIDYLKELLAARGYRKVTQDISGTKWSERG